MVVAHRFVEAHEKSGGTCQVVLKHPLVPSVEDRQQPAGKEAVAHGRGIGRLEAGRPVEEGEVVALVQADERGELPSETNEPGVVEVGGRRPPGRAFAGVCRVGYPAVGQCHQNSGAEDGAVVPVGVVEVQVLMPVFAAVGWWVSVAPGGLG